MTLNNKIQKQFKNFELNAPNYSKNKLYLYADYVELVALLSNETVSSTDIITRLKGYGVELSQQPLPIDGDFGTIEAQVDDKDEEWGNIIFELLSDRFVLYGDDYPYTILNDTLKLKENLTNKHKVYLYLLISSSLKYFKSVSSILTSDFESLSKDVLLSFLPPKAIVKSLGNDSDFAGNAQSKIKELAKLLNVDIRENEIAQISSQNTKEEGLDLVGWIPFKDNNPNTVCLLVQCGCGKDWHSKQLIETGRYSNFFDFYRHPPTHSLFTPYALSNTEGRFYQSKDIISPILLFERHRLMEYYDDISQLDSNLIVEKCLEYQEDIV